MSIKDTTVKDTTIETFVNPTLKAITTEELVAALKSNSNVAQLPISSRIEQLPSDIVMPVLHRITNPLSSELVMPIIENEQKESEISKGVYTEILTDASVIEHVVQPVSVSSLEPTSIQINVPVLTKEHELDTFDEVLRKAAGDFYEAVMASFSQVKLDNSEGFKRYVVESIFVAFNGDVLVKAKKENKNVQMLQGLLRYNEDCVLESVTGLVIE